LESVVTGDYYGGNPPQNPSQQESAVNKQRRQRISTWILAIAMVGTGLARAQTSAPYEPKFPGDPARSEAEAQALGYMRVVLRAQREYKKRHDKYAGSLPALAGTGSLTRRMANTTQRGDYTAGFRSHKDGFVLTMTPKQLDAEHRSFYAEEDGVIHGDDQKPADADSPKVK
jgi:hypothetical protein